MLFILIFSELEADHLGLFGILEIEVVSRAPLFLLRLENRSARVDVIDLGYTSRWLVGFLIRIREQMLRWPFHKGWSLL